MKKVAFREYRQTGALICGVFILLMFIAMVLLFSTTTPANTDMVPYCIFVLIMFLVIGVAGIYYSTLPKVGIKNIEINDTNIFITSYDESQKEIVTDILLKNIRAFKFDIKCEYDYSNANRLDIIISINIECDNEKIYEYTFHTEDYAKIKQMFSLAKYIPNFSYTVATNSQEIHKNIVHLAHTGKNLSLHEYFKTFFANPEVPNSTKIFVKFLMVLLVFYTVGAIIFFCKVSL